MDKKSRFVNVIKKYEALIFKVATLYCDGFQDREDLYQEIVYQLWKSFDSFNEQAKMSTWIYRIALNTAIYNLKSSKRQVNTIPIELESERIADEFDKTEVDKVKMLYESIQSLNLLERGVILLYLEDKSHQEIASIVGISTSNVGTKISRIKEKLKSQITKQN